ncbi:MAG: heparinase II/III family protein, partial [Prolixibacteraceae bacterium]|nr:heparinase II/III family protein [Prolixibacteraceae bacterium]
MKAKFTFVLLICCHCLLFAQKEFVAEGVKLPSHPRILLLNGEEKTLKKNIGKDAVWQEIQNEILGEAADLLAVPVSERVMTGRRLLSVSRENLRRIFILSYAWRMTGDNKFLQRAEAEMLKAASFEDWNPSHFLDVGEMTMALAIGYDWLYPKLSPQTKGIIEKAIVEKGLKPSYDESHNWFVDADHNWNQVCHAGVAYGALAVWEKEPELARRTMNRAIDKMAIPMKHYAPDGAYPEGVGYWEYGTSFNVMFIDAIEKAFGTDYGLSQLPGFLQTSEYMLHMVTPLLNNFAYSDNGARAFSNPTLFWFYDKTRQPEILFHQSRLLQRDGANRIRSLRLAPAMLIWGTSASLSEPKTPDKLFWIAKGDNPVCAMRTSWDDPNAIYVGVKLGSPAVNHGHMDVGSFIIEADGVNWGVDMGGEEYNRLETRGVELWGSRQDAQRWDVFRYNNLAHNALTFNRKYQIAAGYAEYNKFSGQPENMYVTADLTEVYEGQVAKIERAVSLVNKAYIVVEDKIKSENRFTMLTWNFVTPAQASVVDENTLLLEAKGKKLYLKVECPQPVRWKIAPAKSPFTYDSENQGISIVGFDTDLIQNSEQTIRVYLLPGENKSVTYKSVL